MISVFYPISLGRQVFLTCVTLSACILLMLLLGGCTESEEEDEILAEEDVITGSTREDEIGISFPAKWPIAPLTAAQIEEVSQCYLEELAAERYPSIDILPNLKDWDCHPFC